LVDNSSGWLPDGASAAGTRPQHGPAFLLLISLPATAMGFALSVQISVLSWILSTRYGLAIEEIGLVWAAGPLAGIVGQLAVGGLSDRVWLWGGRRRFFIIVGAAIAALAILLLPQIGLVSRAIGLSGVLGVAIAVALALDLAINVGFSPTRALIADVTAEGAERTTAYSVMQLVSGSCGVAAYAIGALFGNDLLIYVAVVVVLLLAIPPALAIAEPRHLPEGRVDSVTGDGGGSQARAGVDARSILAALSPLWAILVYDVHGLGVRLAGGSTGGFAAEAACAVATLGLVAHALYARSGPLGALRCMLAASAFCWLGVQPIFVYMVSFLQGRMPGLGDAALGQTTAFAFLAMNGVAAIAPLLLARLARASGALPVHVAALVLMAGSCGAIWLWVTQPWQLYLLMALCGIGWGSIVSLPFAILSGSVPPARMGLFMGLFNLSVVLPQLVSSLGIGSFVATAEDKGLVFALSGLFLAISALLWSLVPVHRPTPGSEGVMSPNNRPDPPIADRR
jgi:MFS family permease